MGLSHGAERVWDCHMVLSECGTVTWYYKIDSAATCSMRYTKAPLLHSYQTVKSVADSSAVSSITITSAASDTTAVLFEAVPSSIA